MKKIVILIALLCMLVGCFGDNGSEVKKTEVNKERRITQWRKKNQLKQVLN